MANSQLQVILKEQGIENNQAQALLDAFGAPFEEAGVILKDYKTIVVTKEDQFDLMADAREKRLALKKVRTGVENKRKELKENILKEGKAIDSVARFVKEIIEPAESYLEEQEKFAEIKAAERAAAKKAQRIEQIMQYTDNIDAYNLDSMDDTAFDALVATLKGIKDREAEEARLAEEKRIAEAKAAAEEQERVRKENERLKKEAEQREIELAKERAEQEKAAAQARAEAEAGQAKLRAEREAEAKEAQAKLDAEREKREAIERERQEELAKQKAAEEAKEAAKREALLAPDKEKLLALAASLDATELPALASKDAQAVLNQVEELLGKVTKYIRGNVKGL